MTSPSRQAHSSRRRGSQRIGSRAAGTNARQLRTKDARSRCLLNTAICLLLFFLGSCGTPQGHDQASRYVLSIILIIILLSPLVPAGLYKGLLFLLGPRRHCLGIGSLPYHRHSPLVESSDEITTVASGFVSWATCGAIVCKPEAEEEYASPAETSSEDGPVKSRQQGVAEAVEMDEEDEIHV